MVGNRELHFPLLFCCEPPGVWHINIADVLLELKFLFSGVIALATTCTLVVATHNSTVEANDVPNSSTISEGSLVEKYKKAFGTDGFIVQL